MHATGGATANPEHVARVKQGAEAICTWREENPDVRLDLGRADLRKIDLTEADLRHALGRGRFHPLPSRQTGRAFGLQGGEEG
jgi:hypothetical protein